MGAYETFVVVIFFILTAVFVWTSIKSYRQSRAAEEKKLRKAYLRKALLWLTLGLMFFLSALYVILRVSWIFLIVVLIGVMAMMYVVGSGLGASIKEH